MKETQERLDSPGKPATENSLDVPEASEDGMDVSETVEISGIQEWIKHT